MSNFRLNFWHKTKRIEPATARTRNKLLLIAEEGRIKELLNDGEIIKYDKNVSFPLTVSGNEIGVYKADFVTYNQDGTRTVIEVRSTGKRAWQRKLMVTLYDIIIVQTIGEKK